jgi:hypothetical protein
MKKQQSATATTIPAPSDLLMGRPLSRDTRTQTLPMRSAVWTNPIRDASCTPHSHSWSGASWDQIQGFQQRLDDPQPQGGPTPGSCEAVPASNVDWLGLLSTRDLRSSAPAALPVFFDGSLRASLLTLQSERSCGGVLAAIGGEATAEGTDLRGSDEAVATHAHETHGARFGFDTSADRESHAPVLLRTNNIVRQRLERKTRSRGSSRETPVDIVKDHIHFGSSAARLKRANVVTSNVGPARLAAGDEEAACRSTEETSCHRHSFHAPSRRDGATKRSTDIRMGRHRPSEKTDVYQSASR